MFNNIHSLNEAKVILKHLYASGVQYLLDLKIKQNLHETNSNSIFFKFYNTILTLFLYRYKYGRNFPLCKMSGVNIVHSRVITFILLNYSF